MPNRCPPGVLCIENMTIFFIFIILLIILILGYQIFNKNNAKNPTSSSNLDSNKQRVFQGLFPRPSFSFSNIENDVLMNPYEAPLRDNRIFPNSNIEFQNKIPINVPTQSYDSNYRQIGLLTRYGGDKETILPLMGRPLIANRDKWNFYAMSDKNNMIKLQVSIPINSSVRKNSNTKYLNCMGTNGCNDLMNGDLVKVDGYNDLFKVTTYENDSPRYIPYA